MLEAASARNPTIVRLAGVLILGAAVSQTAGCAREAEPNVAAGSGDVRFRIAWATYIGTDDPADGTQEEARNILSTADGHLLFGLRAQGDGLATPGVYGPRFRGGHGDSFVGILSGDGSRLVAGSYFGGEDMERPPYGMAIDGDGAIYFVAGSDSPGLATAGACQTEISREGRVDDGILVKVRPDLSDVDWITYTDGIWPRGGLILDAEDRPVVLGATKGRRHAQKPPCLVTPVRGIDDAIAATFSKDGRRIERFLTVGGDEPERIEESVLGAALDDDGRLLVCGRATSAGMGATPATVQPRPGRLADAWAARLDLGGGAVDWLTYLGSDDTNEGCEGNPQRLSDGSLVVVIGTTTSTDLPVTATSSRHHGGRDGVVGRLEPGGRAWRWLVYVGGSGDEMIKTPRIDRDGRRVYVFGTTGSHDLPVTERAIAERHAADDGANDGFLWVLDARDGALLYGTYLGGDGDDNVRDILVDPADGSVVLVGKTSSTDLPGVRSDAYQPRLAGEYDGYLMRLDASTAPD